MAHGVARNLPLYAWPADRRRLEEMRVAAEKRLERRVIMAEVIRGLLDEHDKALETETA